MTIFNNKMINKCMIFQKVEGNGLIFINYDDFNNFEKNLLIGEVGPYVQSSLNRMKNNHNMLKIDKLNKNIQKQMVFIKENDNQYGVFGQSEGNGVNFTEFYQIEQKCADC